MTREQREQVWNALHAGKVSALRAYGLTKHIEGSRALYDAIDSEICAAMDVINRLDES